MPLMVAAGASAGPGVRTYGEQVLAGTCPLSASLEFRRRLPTGMWRPPRPCGGTFPTANPGAPPSRHLRLVPLPCRKRNDSQETSALPLAKVDDRGTSPRCSNTYPPARQALRNVRAGHGKGLDPARRRRSAPRDAFVLRSAAFQDGGESIPASLPTKRIRRGRRLNGARRPRARRTGTGCRGSRCPEPRPFCHWLVWGLAPQQGKLLEGETPPRVGKNSFGNSEWLLPDPPTGHGPHDYVFQLFAIDYPVGLMPGATRADLLDAIDGHVIAVAVLTATYVRSDEDELDWEEGDGG